MIDCDFPDFGFFVLGTMNVAVSCGRQPSSHYQNQENHLQVEVTGIPN